MEIVQLTSGEIVVRRAGQDEEPLLKLGFSEESQNYLAGATMEVARAMIKAGIEAVFELGLVDSELDLAGSSLEEVLEESEAEEPAAVVHTIH